MSAVKKMKSQQFILSMILGGMLLLGSCGLFVPPAKKNTPGGQSSRKYKINPPKSQHAEKRSEVQETEGADKNQTSQSHISPISPGEVLVDVGTGEEYYTEHIKGALHLNFESDDFRQKISALRKDRMYLIYCHTGAKSGKAVPYFSKYGLRATKVGTLGELKKIGWPVVKRE
jgi:rhodanese-related sulfurtransferase